MAALAKDLERSSVDAETPTSVPSKSQKQVRIDMCPQYISSTYSGASESHISPQITGSGQGFVGLYFRALFVDLLLSYCIR